MILKPLKWVLRRKIMNPTDYVHCCFIGCHGNYCCIWFEHLRVTFFFGGGGEITFKHLYLND